MTEIEVIDPGSGRDLEDVHASVPGLPTSKKRGYAPPRPTLPWERQPGEPAHAYRAFARYRESDDRRQRVIAAEMHMPYGQVSAFARAWKWDLRCNAWDQEVDRRKTQARLKAIAVMEERHVNIALKMQQQVAQRLQSHQAETLSNKDLDRWAEKAVKIERQARGVSTGPGIQVNVTQQQAQQQGQQAVAASVETNVVQASLADILAGNPSQLAEANEAIARLLELGDGHSTGNEDADVPRL